MILCSFFNWSLRSNEEKTFFYFGTIKDINSFCGVPINQCGTKEEVLRTLYFWKNEIDINNVFMQIIEKFFISCLENL